MEREIDVESFLLQSQDLEELLFSDMNVIIKKSKDAIVEEKLLKVGCDLKQSVNFYSNLTGPFLKEMSLGMYSSGTTKGSQTLCLRTKQSILNEISDVYDIFSDFHEKIIMIMVTPNHSFGLIPALLVSRRLSSQVYLGLNRAPLELLRHFFNLKPQVIFAVSAHIRLIREWVKSKGKDISHLERIVYGGAALPEDLINFFEERNITLTSIYGTTQTGAISINKKVRSDNPKNCGAVLNHVSASLANNQEIIVTTSLGEKFVTGDKGSWDGENLIVENRLDSIIFKNGNKIDLNLLQSLINKELIIESGQVKYEKNINGQSEIICVLPKRLEIQHKVIFEKIKHLVPAYALPERFEYL